MQDQEDTYLGLCRDLHATPCGPLRVALRTLQQTHLALPHRGLGPTHAAPVLRILAHNTHLRSANLSHNRLGVGADHFDDLATFVRRNATISELNLANNALSVRGCEALAEALGDNEPLRVLSVRANSAADRGATALCRAAGRSSARLRVLDLADNGVTDAAAAALGALLGGGSALRELDVSWNTLRGAGAALVADGLVVSSLTRLSLAWNSVGDEGAAALAAALADNNALEALDLSSNDIGEAGALDLASAVATNSTLRSLQLASNPLGEVGVAALVEAAGRGGGGGALTDLGVDGCVVRPLGDRRPCTSIKKAADMYDPRNPTGRYRLDLGWPADRALLDALREAARGNDAACFRNCSFAARSASTLAPAAEVAVDKWSKLTSGLVTFDFVAPPSEPTDATLDRSAFARFLRTICLLKDDDRLLKLRIAPHTYSANQIRSLIKLVEYGERVSATTALFRRCADVENFAPKVYALLSKEERRSLLKRLGEALEELLDEEELRQLAAPEVVQLDDDAAAREPGASGDDAALPGGDGGGAVFLTEKEVELAAPSLDLLMDDAPGDLPRVLHPGDF